MRTRDDTVGASINVEKEGARGEDAVATVVRHSCGAYLQRVFEQYVAVVTTEAKTGARYNSGELGMQHAWACVSEEEEEEGKEERGGEGEE